MLRCPLCCFTHGRSNYDSLIVAYAGGKEKISFRSLAKKWDVSTTQIERDRDKIFRMIRKAVEKVRKD